MKTKIRRLRDNLLGDISKKSGLKIPYFVFTIALIVTIAVTYFFYSSAKTIDAERFDNDIIKIRATIENRLDTYIAILRAGRGYFRSSEKVTREKFAEFVGNISLQRNYPGMQAIGFSKVFTADEKESIEKQIKEEGFPNFTIKPETPRNEYQSIIFIEPFDEVNKKAHGFDMSSEPVRKAALDKARDTGVYAISGKITLIQEDEAQPQPGFLIYLAVYKGNAPNSVEERRKQLDGFIYSPFRMGSFIKDVVNEIKTETVSFRIYDNEVSENNLLGIGVEEDKTTNSTLKAQNEIDAGGRKWIITYQPSAKFNNQSLAWWTPIIFLLGLVTSVILFFLSLSQSRTNVRLLNIANELAQSEDEIHKLLESEQNARETAEKLNKVKDEFISVVSHELRTPLNAISGWVNVLKSQSLSEETKNRAISVINKNLRSQVSLVDNMIDFSDSSFLQNQSKWQKVVFSDIVDSCILEKDEAITNQKLRLTKEFTKEISVIYCDQAKVKKAILYLLDNAIKFTPEGGLIGINLTSDNYQLELKIKDTGDGIPPDLLPNIFNIFNQSDSSTTRKKGGLGLGLALVKKIVEAHGGQVTAESEGLGKGSIFTIKFPLTKK